MIRIRPLAAMLLTVAAIAGPACAQGPQLDWRVEDRGDASGEVQLTLSYRTGHGDSSYGRTVPLAELAGLGRAQLDGASAQPVRFRLVRDAGAFACEGSAERQLGAGVCDFQPNPAFVQRLRAAGSGEADGEQLLTLATADVGAAYLDELKRQRYATPSVAELVSAAQHGVGLNFLQAMGAAGYRLGALPALARLRDHGVSTRYVAAMRAAGYADLSADDLVRLRDHGVSENFIAELRDLGYRSLAAEDLVRLRDHGVTASFIRRVNLDGTRLAPTDLIRLRDRGDR